MESSTGIGCMAVLAVSGTVVLVALRVHKRLLSDFMKKVELELDTVSSSSSSVESGSVNFQPKKKVRFADDVLEPSSNIKEYRERHSRMLAKTNQIPETAVV